MDWGRVARTSQKPLPHMGCRTTPFREMDTAGEPPVDSPAPSELGGAVNCSILRLWPPPAPSAAGAEGAAAARPASAATTVPSCRLGVGSST
jgi:hypothetical protein